MILAVHVVSAILEQEVACPPRILNSAPRKFLLSTQRWSSITALDTI